MPQTRRCSCPAMAPRAPAPRTSWAASGSGLQGALVNSSRGILFAGKQQPEKHWKDAAAAGAMDAMAAELRAALLG